MCVVGVSVWSREWRGHTTERSRLLLTTMNIRRNMDSQGEDTGEGEGAGRGGEVGPTPEEEGKEEDRLAELYKVI